MQATPYLPKVNILEFLRREFIHQPTLSKALQEASEQMLSAVA